MNGHDVETVHKKLMCGAPDENIWRACKQENRILLTLDLDFADITAYPPGDSHGTVVLRPPNQSVPAIRQLIEKFLRGAMSESPGRSLWIVEHGRIRISKNSE